MNKILEYDQFISQAHFFLDRLTSFLNQLNFDYQQLFCDHICFRVETQEQYIYFKKLLEQNGELLAESLVGGRLISNFKLSAPLKHDTLSIPVVELPSPKLSSPYALGFEHVEFVTMSSLEEFMQTNSYLDFNVSGLMKEINRDVKIILGNNIAVKFHEHSIEEVIAWEKD